MKPSPPVHETISLKRPRSALRVGTSKKKVLMDDMMVLHGEYVSYAFIRLCILDMIFKLYFISQVFSIVLKFLMFNYTIKFLLIYYGFETISLICSSLFVSSIDF